LTGIIDVLAKKGLLQKTESKTDKRSSVLQLTQKGKKLREEIPFLYEFIEKKMFQGITVINQKLIREFVNQMIQNLEWEIKGN
jgi:DNA-binding MarR family transcriptional regulator